MIFSDKRNSVFLVLAGFFITNAIVAELIGAKLILVDAESVEFGPFILSVGIIPWPVVFITTDLINEYYGQAVVRRLSILTACLIAYAFVILYFALQVPSAKGVSVVTDEQFSSVFGQSQWIIVGSIIAFLVSQYVDVFIFWLLRNKTGSKMIWLRSTGSTVVSQLIDSFIVVGIAFWLPNKVTTNQFINMALSGYTFKLVIAIGLIPLIYAGHNIVDKYLGEKNSQRIVAKSAEESLHHSVED